jgi:hypothetical protein
MNGNTEMNINALVKSLDKAADVCSRDHDGKARMWMEPGRGTVLSVDGRPRFQRVAERLLLQGTQTAARQGVNLKQDHGLAGQSLVSAAQGIIHLLC